MTCAAVHGTATTNHRIELMTEKKRAAKRAALNRYMQACETGCEAQAWREYVEALAEIEERPLRG